jgi:formyl-CoA transferase
VIHLGVPEKFWRGLLSALERSELAEDPRFKTRDARRDNSDDLQNELAKVFATRPRHEWLKRLEENDVPAGPLYDLGEVVEDPQVQHLDMIEETIHPKAGSMKFIGSAVTYEEFAKIPPRPPPLPGEHTRSLLEELGYAAAQIEKLEAGGVVKSTVV